MTNSLIFLLSVISVAFSAPCFKSRYDDYDQNVNDFHPDYTEEPITETEQVAGSAPNLNYELISANNHGQDINNPLKPNRTYPHNMWIYGNEDKQINGTAWTNFAKKEPMPNTAGKTSNAVSGDDYSSLERKIQTEELPLDENWNEQQQQLQPQLQQQQQQLLQQKIEQLKLQLQQQKGKKKLPKKRPHQFVSAHGGHEHNSVNYVLKKLSIIKKQAAQILKHCNQFELEILMATDDEEHRMITEHAIENSELLLEQQWNDLLSKKPFPLGWLEVGKNNLKTAAADSATE